MQAQFARAHPLVDDSGVVDDYARAKIGTHDVGDDDADDDDDDDDDDEDKHCWSGQKAPTWW